MGRTLLLAMPCAPVERPPVGLHLLQAGLERAGELCDVRYPNLTFAQLLSPRLYHLLVYDFPRASLVGEWVFKGALFPESDADEDEYFVRWACRRLTEEHEEALLRARALAAPFIEHIVDFVDWHAYNVVGFSSCGDQNLASLALARRIKEMNRKIVVAFGGPDWHDGMGPAQHGQAPFVDAGFTGEADDSFIRFVQVLNSGGLGVCRGIPGISLWRDGRTVVEVPAERVGNLDDLPVPDYRDYFTARAQAGLDTGDVLLAIEGSRGCSWADHSACRFCGIIGADHRYRTKSGPRLLRELRLIHETYPSATLELTDNVVSPDFLEFVLPQLAARPLGAPLFVEVRPDVPSEAVRLLAQAGISVQAGVESLNDHQLRLMSKGTTALQNIRFLRDCRDYGVPVYWNLLSKVPGETDEDYDDLAEKLPLLESLPAPQTCGPVRLDRFSVYFREQERHGYLWSRAHKAYRHVYPYPSEVLDELAYTFDFGRDESEKSLGRRLRAVRLLYDVRDWQQAGPSCVRAIRKEECLVVEDSRPHGSADGLELSLLDEAVCRAAVQVVRRRHMVFTVQKSLSDHGKAPSEQSIDASVRKMLVHRLLLEYDGRCLTLLCLGAHL